MATGIDKNHPEYQKGMELFEELFRDRPARSPPPRREETEEERQKGFELFDELFADRLYPPEELTPTSQEDSFEDSDEYVTPVVKSPSPVKESPPRRRRGRRPVPMRKYMSPPKWLTHSIDRDSFPEKRHPDWFRRRTDPSYPRSPIHPPYPPHPHASPAYWAIEEYFRLKSPEIKDDIFVTPPPGQVQVGPLEPPLPDFPMDPSVPVTDFDTAMHKMHWELQKYKHDKKYIVKFVEITPLIRDTQILTQELEALVRLYIPGTNTDGMGPLIASYAIADYIKETESKLHDRYEESFEYKYPDISQGILAAEVRLHKQKALDAIDSFKRGYFILLKEIEKAEAELERAKQEEEKENAIVREMMHEEARLIKEEEKAEKEFMDQKEMYHVEHCHNRAESEAEFRKYGKLRRLVLKLREELRKTKDAHEREVKEMSHLLTLFPPNFEDRIRSLLRSSLTPRGYEPVPVEFYVEMVQKMDEDHQRKRDVQVGAVQALEGEVEIYKKMLDEKMAELEEARRTTHELLEEQNALRPELHNLRQEINKRTDLWLKLREEILYYKDYNEMLLGKIIVLQTDASFRSEDLPAITGPKSRSPSPVGTAKASPPAFGSEMFNISQIESSPRFGESPDILDEQPPSSEMLNLSDMSRSGGSPEDESPQGQDEPDSLEEERPASEMLSLSDMSPRGGSPADESPQGQVEPDSLEEERPLSEMLNFSDLSQSGGSPVSDNLDDERPPSEMLEFSGFQGGGSFLDSPEDSESAGKKTLDIPSPDKMDPLRMEVQIIPQAIRRSPSGEGVVCDVAVQMRSGGSPVSDNLDNEKPTSEMLEFSGLQGGESFLDSPEGSESAGKKTLDIPSPDKMDPLRMQVEIIPQAIRRSPSGERVVCDVAVQMQEAALKRPRWIEKRYNVVRGTPPISQTVGRRVDRRYGMFTPQSAIRRQHLGVRRPLFAGDFESPESPWGTGRRTHPELMNLPQRPPSPRPPRLDTTMEWEDPEMNN